MRLPALFLLAVAAAAGTAPVRAGGDAGVVTAWNEEAYEIAFAEDQFMTFKGQRAMALMHLAMHDALNAIAPRYEPYTCSGKTAGADPAVAVAQAAHHVLSALYPDRRDRLDEELDRWLAPARQGLRKERALLLGRACAEEILALRAADRWDYEGTYQFRSAPGAYRTTPEWDGFMLQPGFGSAEPLALDRPDQFRPPPPPPLQGPRYARALQEVKEAGRKEGSRRTDDQSAYAIWWMEFSEGAVTRLARSLVARREPDLWETARMFALLHTSLYDTYIAVWDSKYEYNHWRPATAIRHSSDPEWEAMLPAPPFPEYVSAHAGGCAAAFAILEKTFGPDVAFTMQTRTAPEGMPSRRFPGFRAAADECADSRIRLGWHFRYATDAGLELGRTIADYVARTHLRPRK